MISCLILKRVIEIFESALEIEEIKTEEDKKEDEMNAIMVEFEEFRNIVELEFGSLDLSF